MSVSVEVVIPFAGDCPHRRRALSWTLRHYPTTWKVTVAEGGSPWTKAKAVTPAIEASDAETVVVADADVWTDGFGEAVAAVELGQPWAIPFTGVFRLTAQATERILAGELPRDPHALELDENAYRGRPGGGSVVALRELLLDVPLDPRFIGWGQEDESWGMALTTLAGQPHRCRHALIHLWHPPQERLSREFGSPEGRDLRERYEAACASPDAMRALISEVA